jgi:hypothetical protein
VEYVKNPVDHIAEILRRVKPEYIAKTYAITAWDSDEHFLEQIAKKRGRLLKVMCQPVLSKRSSHHFKCTLTPILSKVLMFESHTFLR